MTATERSAQHRFPAPLVDGALPADFAAVTELRQLVVALARAHGADDELIEQIGLATTEAVTNVVLHAYRGGEAGRVYLAADVENDDLEIVVSDDGHGMRQRNPRGRGHGLMLIAACTTEHTITERRRGIDVWMRFDLRSAT